MYQILITYPRMTAHTVIYQQRNFLKFPYCMLISYFIIKVPRLLQRERQKIWGEKQAWKMTVSMSWKHDAQLQMFPKCLLNKWRKEKREGAGERKEGDKDKQNWYVIFTTDRVGRLPGMKNSTGTLSQPLCLLYGLCHVP